MTKVIVPILLFLVCSMAGAQQVAPGAQQAAPGPVARPPGFTAEDRLRLATSSPNYPVTSGDIYRLTYQQGAVPSTLDIQVGSDSTIQLNIFGKLNAAGMTFAAVKQAVEKAFTSAYPRSFPSLAISAVGTFHVFVKGETPETMVVEAWGMSRLSDVLEGRLDPYSSIRNVRVISADGTNKDFDLFQFERSGLLDQDPYLRPGDSVVLSTAERIVEVRGEVKRPGRYQPLHSDQLTELIDSYGGGLTTSADPSRVKIERMSGDTPRTLSVDMSQPGASATVLDDGDIVTVPSKADTLPVAFFEGAVIPGAPPPAAAAAAPEPPGMLSPIGYNRIAYSFRDGETLRNALLSIRKSILPVANLAGGFLVRAGTPEPIPVDLSALLMDTDPADMPLRPLDRIIIPAAQFSVGVYGDVARPGNYSYAPARTYRYYADLAGFADIEEISKNIVILAPDGNRLPVGAFIEPGSRIYLTASHVTVQGAVVNPGNFPYRSDFTALDYMNQAGGFDPEKSNNGRATVFDSRGTARKQGDPLQPGDRIYVYADNFGYNFTRDLPIIVSIITAVSTVVTIYALVR